MVLEMSKLEYDQTFEAILGFAAGGIVLSALWIVYILVQIEQNKMAFYSVGEDDDPNSLDLQVEEEEDGMEVEKQQPPQPPESSSPKRNSRNPTKASTKRRKIRKVRFSFKLTQFASVGVLILLTYLLLVQSNAPMWLSGIGSMCVFGVFLRFQIGDELRRQRLDRLCLMIANFLLIASLLSLSTYAMKSLSKGEIYEGPARIVGYDQDSYNNSDHDPSTRTDLMVQWGKDWGCPLSGSKVCQAHVSGAMCQVKTTDDSEGDDEGDRLLLVRKLADDQVANTNTNDAAGNNTDAGGDNNDAENQEDLQAELDQEKETNEDLEAQVEQEEAEKEELEEEVAEMQDETAETEEEEEDLEESAEMEEEETQDVANEEVAEVEEEELEDAEIYDVEVEEIEEEVMEYAEGETSNSEDAAAYADYEQEYESLEDETVTEYEDALDSKDEEIEEDEEDVEEDEEEVEEIEEDEDNIAEEYEDGGEEETEEEEEYAGYVYDAYWDESTYEYDDDLYESEYWDYDWDSVWGEYACEDLFDNDVQGETYDATIKPGQDGDDWPYISIYGSCKTCEAYILDYFAEEAFEAVDDYKKQAILFLTGALASFVLSLVGYVKYKVSPTNENELDLLGCDGGVLA